MNPSSAVHDSNPWQTPRHFMEGTQSHWFDGFYAKYLSLGFFSFLSIIVIENHERSGILHSLKFAEGQKEGTDKNTTGHGRIP